VKYSIEIPNSDLNHGKLNIFLKYITYFIIGWFVSWIILLYRSTDNKYTEIKLVDFIFDNPGLFSALISLFVVGFLVNRVYTKFKLGQMISIEILPNSSSLILELVNTFNGNIWKVDIPFNHLKVYIDEKENKLFGKQRIVTFFNNGKEVTKINIELTAWCRHSDIDSIISKLKVFKK